MVQEAATNTQHTSFGDLEQYYKSITHQPDEDKLKKKVCVYWLRNQCKKKDKCEYKHMYNEEDIPICKFFKENGYCHL